MNETIEETLIKHMNHIGKLTKQRDKLLAACEDLIDANEVARQVSLKNEPSRGMIWGGIRSQLDAAKLRAEVIIAEAKGD